MIEGTGTDAVDSILEAVSFHHVDFVGIDLFSLMFRFDYGLVAARGEEDTEGGSFTGPAYNRPKAKSLGTGTFPVAVHAQEHAFPEVELHVLGYMGLEVVLDKGVVDDLFAIAKHGKVHPVLIEALSLVILEYGQGRVRLACDAVFEQLVIEAQGIHNVSTWLAENFHSVGWLRGVLLRSFG